MEFKEKLVAENHVCIYLGKRTRKKIDKYAYENDISRSAVIKLAVNHFLKEINGCSWVI